MLRKLFLLLVLLVVGAAAALYFFGSGALNRGVKSGVETFGPKITQTDVRLDGVDLSVFSGKGTLTGLFVGNPEGFSGDNIFALEQIDMTLNTRSVFSDTVVIEKLHLRAPKISYEKTLRSSNLKELLENIEASTGGAPDPGDGADKGAGKQVVIRDLVIEDATVFVGAMGAGVSTNLPRIQMADIGGGGEKRSIAEAVRLITREIFKAVGPSLADMGKSLSEGGKAMLDQTTEKGREQLENATKGAAKEAAEKANESLKGLLGE